MLTASLATLPSLHSNVYLGYSKPSSNTLNVGAPTFPRLSQGRRADEPFPKTGMGRPHTQGSQRCWDKSQHLQDYKISWYLDIAQFGGLRPAQHADVDAGHFSDQFTNASAG
jgi:hypothetical protein